VLREDVELLRFAEEVGLVRRDDPVQDLQLRIPFRAQERQVLLVSRELVVRDPARQPVLEEVLLRVRDEDPGALVDVVPQGLERRVLQ